MEEPFTSIILSNYNGLIHIKECFDSLLKLNYKNFEIIFIDNNSQDKSIEFVRKNYPNVKIIENKKDYGFSKANNIAATYAKGKYIALLNIDTVVDANWLTRLVKVAEKSDKIGITVSKMYYYHNKDIINYAGGSCDKYLKGVHIGDNKRDNKSFSIQMEVFFACGAAILIKRELYNKIGLFDPLYYAYCEDLDLSWRTWLIGYKVVYVPTSFIYHKIGQILGPRSPRKMFLSEKNRLRTLLKNYELKTLFIILPIYFGKRMGIIVKKVLKFDISAIIHLYVYIKAIFWNIIHTRSLLKNRQFISLNRIKDDNFILNLMKKSTTLEKSLMKI
ncbi:MAG: glycosyltransferase family 2 protein [Candidatus Lokiarchaeota archaeon]|nr:glycosyltransferase family 2 protein [Candidatus Lokiarchaeota archaeon]